MALLSDKFKAAIRESISSFVLLIVLLAAAVILSYVEEALEALHRPKLILYATRVASNAALLADMIVFGRLLWFVVSHTWSRDEKDKREDNDES